MPTLYNRLWVNWAVRRASADRTERGPPSRRGRVQTPLALHGNFLLGFNQEYLYSMPSTNIIAGASGTRSFHERYQRIFRGLSALRNTRVISPVRHDVCYRRAREARVSGSEKLYAILRASRCCSFFFFFIYFLIFFSRSSQPMCSVLPPTPFSLALRVSDAPSLGPV